MSHKDKDGKKKKRDWQAFSLRLPSVSFISLFEGGGGE
jgi:hypothetical protein